MTTTKKSGSDGFSAAEREAMKARAQELKAQGRSGAKAGRQRGRRARRHRRDAGCRPSYRRTHPRTRHRERGWFFRPGPGTACLPTRRPDGKLICFFKAASKFEGRYAMLGFEDAATLDDGPMWPVVFAIVEWTPAVEKKVVALVKTATA